MANPGIAYVNGELGGARLAAMAVSRRAAFRGRDRFQPGSRVIAAVQARVEGIDGRTEGQIMPTECVRRVAAGAVVWAAVATGSPGLAAAAAWAGAAGPAGAGNGAVIAMNCPPTSAAVMRSSSGDPGC
ncbi:MAG TPA: hypothetical protein VFO01_14685 [Trebonia sp.]|nr:hypothetical protein [Trebonia sp.]